MTSTCAVVRFACDASRMRAECEHPHLSYLPREVAMALFRVDHDLCVPCPPEDLPWPWQSPDRYQWFAEAEDMIDWPTEGPSLHRLRDGWWFDAGGPAYPGAPDESGWMFAGRTVKNALRFVDDEYIRRWERDEDGNPYDDLSGEDEDEWDDPTKDDDEVTAR